jgi:hypothetical protein
VIFFFELCKLDVGSLLCSVLFFGKTVALLPWYFGRLPAENTWLTLQIVLNHYASLRFLLFPKIKFESLVQTKVILN